MYLCRHFYFLFATSYTYDNLKNKTEIHKLTTCFHIYYEHFYKMSILVTFYSNVSHAYTVSNFSIQNPVLSKLPSFCANWHLSGYGRLSGKDTRKFLSGSTLPPLREKAEHGGSIWLGIHVKLIRLN